MTKVEVRGLALEMDEDALYDADVVDMLYSLSTGAEIPPVKRLVVAVFGKWQYAQIADSLRDERGHVSIVALSEFFAEAITAANEKKS